MEDSYPHVFLPFRLGGFDLRNRLVALPAGTSLVENGVPTHGDVEHFERLAQGGVGLVIAGAMVVHPTSALRSGKLVEGYLDAVRELTRKHGISRATYFNWRSKYGGVSVSELKRMKELEAENAKLKRMYAELALENAAIKDVLSRKL